jgi:hypothetical protein
MRTPHNGLDNLLFHGFLIDELQGIKVARFGLVLRTLFSTLGSAAELDLILPTVWHIVNGLAAKVRLLNFPQMPRRYFLFYQPFMATVPRELSGP